MALFSRKTPAKKPAKAKSKDQAKAATPSVKRNLSGVLKTPRITEKAMRQSENNVYAFEIARSANKHEVAAAVKQLFNVTPVRVNIVNKTARQYKSRTRGRRSLEHGMKKAYVYLKKGDNISLI